MTAPRDGTASAAGGGNEFTFPDAIAIVRRHLVLILTSVVLGAVVAYGASRMLEPRFAASATVVLERREASLSAPVAAIERQERDGTAVQTEIDTIRSRSFAANVVDALGLVDDPRYNPYLAAYAADRGAVERLNMLIASAAAVVKDPAGAQAVETDTGSRSALGPAPDLPPIEEQRAEVVGRLLQAFSVSRTSDQSLAMRIVVTSQEPGEAARIANAIADYYIESSLEQRRATAEAAIDALQERAETLAAEIRAAERRLAEYGRIVGAPNDRSLDLLAAQVVELNSQLTRARVELAENEARVEQIESFVRDGLGSAAAFLSSPLLGTLQGERARLEREQAEIALSYGEEHPRMQNKIAEIESVDELIRKELERIMLENKKDTAVARARVDQLRTELTGLERQRQEQDLSEIELRQLEREAEVKRQRQRTLGNSIDDLERQVASLTADARVVSAAEPPDEPFFPRPKLMIAGGIAGSFALAFIGILLIEGIDQSVRSGYALQRRLPIKHFGYVPRMDRRVSRRRRGLLRYMRRTPQSLLEEALRSVLWRAAPLGWRDRDTGSKVLLVTSATPGEGKSFVSLALAATAATTGRRTLLLDFDLRRSGITRHLAPRQKGLKSLAAQPRTLLDYLSGNADIDAVTIEDPDIPNLSVICTREGRARQNATFYSPRLPELFDTLRKRYDLVIVDTPPALIVNEALELSEFADIVLLVARWGSTREPEVVATLERFAARDPGTMGLVVNGICPRRHRYYEVGGVAAEYSDYAKNYLRT